MTQQMHYIADFKDKEGKFHTERFDNIAQIEQYAKQHKYTLAFYKELAGLRPQSEELQAV